MQQNATSVSQSDPMSPVVRLIAAVRSFSMPGYAVIDGGQFDDLPPSLKNLGIFGRSLFLNSADKVVEEAGPWLVALGREPLMLERIIKLVGDRPAVVFWSSDGGETLLHKHLRTINMVRIPSWAANGENTSPIEESNDYETVLFRHWDPRVLGTFLPTLDSYQFARVIGPAAEIAFQAPECGGLKRVIYESTWPKATTKILTIRSEQISDLNRRRKAVLHQRIASYLRNVAESQTRHLDNYSLLQKAAQYDSEADKLGFRSERDKFLWSFSQATSTVNLANQPVVIRYLSDPSVGSTASERLTKIFDLRTRILQAKD